MESTQLTARAAGDRFDSSDAVQRLAAAFDDCSLPRSAWTHAAHLAVAAWYVIWHGPEMALDKVRTGIQRYNEAHGVTQSPDGGYHDTITRFYVWAVTRQLAVTHLDRSLSDIVNDVVGALAGRELLDRYYSKARLSSWAARTSWVEPDLRPLEWPEMSARRDRSPSGLRLDLDQDRAV